MKNTTLDLGEMKSSGEFQTAPPVPKRKRRTGRRLLAWIVGVGVVLYVWNLIASYESWRAIFLSNNQVYFGHFWDVPFSSAITLHDVYYLEVAEPNQQLSTDDQSEVQQLKLVKLGNEIHGPTDEMTIPMEQVLFWETLRPDSAVVAAIKSLTP
jgi:hypothetical protein